MQQTLESCTQCNRNVALQMAVLLDEASQFPTFFEANFAVYYEYCKPRFLAISNQLSGWIEIIAALTNLDLSKSQCLIRLFRN